MNIPTRLSRQAITAFIAFLAAFALAGCSSNPTSSSVANTNPAAGAATQPDPLGATAPASSARKPCEYLARADAEAVAGQPLPTTREDIAAGECDYLTADFFGATLRVGDWPDISFGATQGPHKGVSISGVGDEALNLDIPNQGSDLFVRKGDRGFHLGLTGQNIDNLPDHGLEKEKILAQKILANF